MRAHLTKQRSAVLEIVKSACDHPTAADVMDRLRQHNHKFAYATVYNSLNYLVAQKLITELRIDGGVTRYDGRLEAHHHAVCEACGQVLEVMVQLPDDFLANVERATGLAPTSHEVTLRGLCAACRAKTS